MTFNTPAFRPGLYAGFAAAVMSAALGASLVAAGSLAASEPKAASKAEPKAVIELFTSQGCSSCPPADKLLGELATDPSIIALTLPVDYWDYIGWKDTLALQGHAKRQKSYAFTRGDRAVYTPQAVVNGAAHALGSDKAAIEEAVAKSRAGQSTLTVPVTMKIVDGKVVVDVAAGKLAEEGKSADVWLCPVTNKIKVTIERGENRGQSLDYFNVVRRWVKLGVWTGKAETYSIALSDIPNANYTMSDINSLAVLVQNSSSGKPGPLAGAASVALK